MSDEIRPVNQQTVSTFPTSSQRGIAEARETMQKFLQHGPQSGSTAPVAGGDANHALRQKGHHQDVVQKALSPTDAGHGRTAVEGPQPAASKTTSQAPSQGQSVAASSAPSPTPSVGGGVGGRGR